MPVLTTRILQAEKHHAVSTWRGVFPLDNSIPTTGKLRDMIEDRVKHYWTLRAHDFGAVRRNELENQMSKRWLAEIRRSLPDRKPLDILDVGTGTGFFAVQLAQEGHRVQGIDLTPEIGIAHV